MKDDIIGKPLIPSNEENRKKSINREQEFNKALKQNPDIIKKRMGSDLFKGGKIQ